MLIRLIQNIALLAMLAFCLQIVDQKVKGRPLLLRALQGLLFGLTCIAGMLTSVQFAPGIAYDGRSIVIILAGLSGGPIPAIIAAVIGAGYWTYAGGAGAWIGNAVMVEAAALGIGLHYLRKRNARWERPLRLLLLGFLMHGFAMALQLLLPGEEGWGVWHRVGLFVLLGYSLAFLLAARVFIQLDQRQKAMRKLIESEEQYRSLFENSHSVMLILDPETGALVDANPAAEAFYGWSREQLKSMNISEINTLPAADIRAGLRDAHQGQRTRFLVSHQLADRSVRDVEVYSGAIVIRGKQLLYSMVYDITDRNHASEALRREHERLEFVIDGSRLGTWAWNVQTNEIVFNKTWAAMLGYAVEELMPHSFEVWKSLIHPEDLPSAQKALMDCAQGQVPQYMREVRMRHKDGHWVWVLDQGRVMTRDASGRPLSMFGTHADITEIKQAEELQHESERYLHAILQTTIDGFLIVDHDARIAEVNDAYCSMTGYEREEILGRSVDWLEADEPLQDIRVRIGRIMVNGSEWFESRHRRKDGSIFPVDVSVTFFPERGGEFICFCRDLTERKRAEEKLVHSHDLMRYVVEHLHGAIAIHDKDLRYIYVSQRYLDDCEVEARDIIGKHHYEVFPEILQKWKDVHQKALAGEVSSSERDVYVRKDGSVCYTRWECRPWFNADGSIGGIIVYTEVITDRVQAEEALRKSEAFNAALIACTPFALYSIDMEETVQSWNQAAERILGWSAAEVIGKPLPIVPEDQAESLAIIKKQTEEGRTVLGMEVPCRRKDGSIFTGRLSFAVIRDSSGRIAGAVCTIEDVTGSKDLEEQLRQAQKMESVGRLAGGVAHDFNNMLGVILGHTELVLGELPAGTALHANLEEIQKAAQRSANLTRQLLAFARRQTIVPRILDLNETVEAMLNMLRRLIGEAINLVWEPAKTPAFVLIDPVQIDQILANLLVNARDAIGPGTGRITIKTGVEILGEEYCASHAGCVPGRYVTLAVCDDGCGMDESTKSQVFDPFFTTKPVGQGTGLGLATVYGIVRQNNGFIDLQSERGQGTVFRIHLPSQLPAVRTVEDERTGVAPQAKGEETILLVEDEATLLALTSTMLKRLGYRVLPASTPGEALRLAEQHKEEVQLLITDVVMPEMNGRELAGILASTCPNLKCLYMSGYVASVIAPHGVLDEEVPFIEKPFSMQDLGAKIWNMLHKT